MAPMATGGKVPSDGAELISATAAIAPHRQATSNSVSGISSARAASDGIQADVSSGEPTADAASLSSTLTGSTSNIESTPFNKELPPKPVLRCAESPERRGIYDAFDSGSERVKCAPLQPSPPSTASPSPIGSDSFELSPSLRCDPYNSPKVAVGTTVNARKVSANPVVVRAKNSGALCDERDRSGPPLKATEPECSSLLVSTQRRLPTTGQIVALRNGSQVSRHAPESRFNAKSTYSSQKSIQRPKTGAKKEMRVMENVSDAGSAHTTGFGSPQQLDDPTRRSMKYGLGATIRSSRDAREIIMGESRSFSGASNTSAGTRLSSKSVTTGDSSKVLLPNAAANGKTRTRRADRFPPRVSSLPATPSNVVTKPSIASRLARPTKASSARAAANNTIRKSGTMTSVKKFGSRLTSIIPGRRRPDLPGSVAMSNSSVGVDEKDAAGARFATVKENSSTNTDYASSINGRALLTTYEDSGMELSCSQFVRAGPDGALIGELTDKVAPQQSQRDERERQTAVDYASEAHIHTNNGRTRLAAIQQRRHRQDDEDEPPTPPPTRGGPRGHYAEEEQVDDQQEEQRELQWLHDSSTIYLPPAGNTHFIQMMRQAESTLQLLIAAAGRVEDLEIRGRMVHVVEAVAESLSAANRTAAAIISLRDANERLLTTTIALGWYANRMSARAAQRNGDQ